MTLHLPQVKPGLTGRQGLLCLIRVVLPQNHRVFGTVRIMNAFYTQKCVLTSQKLTEFNQNSAH
jgi:hypothetical protein